MAQRRSADQSPQLVLVVHGARLHTTSTARKTQMPPVCKNGIAHVHSTRISRKRTQIQNDLESANVAGATEYRQCSAHHIITVKFWRQCGRFHELPAKSRQSPSMFIDPDHESAHPEWQRRAECKPTLQSLKATSFTVGRPASMERLRTGVCAASRARRLVQEGD